MLTKFYNLEDFALAVGESPEVLSKKRRAGTFFPPDTVFNKKPYWFRETVDRYLSLKTIAISQAFGSGNAEDSSCSVDALGMRW